MSRANYDIPSLLRCTRCKGWGTVYAVTGSSLEPDSSYNHGLPLHPQDMIKCPDCAGTGRKELR